MYKVQFPISNIKGPSTIYIIWGRKSKVWRGKKSKTVELYTPLNLTFKIFGFILVITYNPPFTNFCGTLTKKRLEAFFAINFYDLIRRLAAIKNPAATRPSFS